MPLVNPYCTVAEVRSQLKDASARLDVELIEKAINAASRAVDRWCSGGVAVQSARRFWRDSEPTTRIYVADDPTMLWVDDFCDPASLVVKTDDNDDGVYETTWTIGADFQPEPLNGDVVAEDDAATPHAFWRLAAVGHKRWPVHERRAGVLVTATYGWSAVPDEVTQATILKAVSLFMRKDAPFGIAGMNDFGPVRITRVDPDVIDLLTPYRKVRPRTLTYGAQRHSLFHQRRW